jgi:hypothetical protein
LVSSDENPDNWTLSPSDCEDIHVEEKDLQKVGWRPVAKFNKVMITHLKWLALRQPVLSAVGSYKPVDYTPKCGQRLTDRFRDSGLQIIVKMVSIELTPEKPLFPIGGWHVEGQMNEHICGTALYYLDSENVTSSNLSFRMQTDADLNDEKKWQVGQNQYDWLEMNFGTNFGYGGHASCLQNYGRVETREGRLLCFPNNL